MSHGKDDKQATDDGQSVRGDILRSQQQAALKKRHQDKKGR